MIHMLPHRGHKNLTTKASCDFTHEFGRRLKDVQEAKLVCDYNTRENMNTSAGNILHPRRYTTHARTQPIPSTKVDRSTSREQTSIPWHQEPTLAFQYRSSMLLRLVTISSCHNAYSYHTRVMADGSWCNYALSILYNLQACKQFLQL